MAYCHECGEQVAENDGFCPYCGITLQPIAVADGDEGNSQSEIIAGRQPEMTAVMQSGEASVKTPPSPFDNELSSAPNGILSENLTDNKINDFSNDITAANLDSQMESVEIPPKVNSGEIARFENQTNENPNGNIQQELAHPNFSKPPADIRAFSEAPMPKILETLEPIVDSAESNPACTEGKLVEASAAKAANAAEIMDAEGINLEPVFVSTEGETVESAVDAIDSETKIEEELAPEISQTESSLMSYEEADVREILSAEEPEKSVDEEIDQINETETPASEMPIAMPAVELPEAEICPPSRFDSVSIMEKQAEPVEQKPAPAIVAQTPAVEQKDERSFTTPNIGVGTDTDGKNKTKLKPLDEGTVLNGRYEIIRKIGGGGMGAVYLASDKNLGGVLRAVKEMVQSYIEDTQQEKAVNDFRRESLLLTSLDHQSIPTIYDYFFDDTEARFYLVMKYISGGDLAGRLRAAPEGRIDETSITQWAIQIADVLDYLHNRQPPIVYRDLKPANIMIDGNSGRVMLIDFGIARWVNKEEKGVTAVGTMGYAPPELFSGNVESRSDIYSLGSTMFHLLTGADPQSNPLLIFDFQKHPRPRQINPQLSDQMERILMRAVEYSADKRFSSAAEMRHTLEEHLSNLKANRLTFGVKEAPVSVALSDQPVFCGFCGQKIVATDMFCAFCGAKQPLAQKGVHAHSEGYAPAPLTAQLLLIGTNELEQPAFRLEKEDNLVGRRDPMSNIFPEVDLSKFDPQTKISRRHARIWRQGSEFMVEDLGSSNGTYILPVVRDTMRLQPHQPQLLTNGDKIKLGDTTLHFILG
jgi:serine/threonine-protein kinase